MVANSSVGVLLGVSVTVFKLALAAGVALVLIGALLFWGLIRHTKAQSRPLSADELGYLLTGPHSIGEEPAYTKAFGATGRGVDFSFNIDSLRNAYKRGDRFLFWGGPAAMTSLFLGLWSLTFAAGVGLAWSWGLFLMISIFFVFVVGVSLFMPWAALYTNIDLGADSPDAADKQPGK